MERERERRSDEKKKLKKKTGMSLTFWFQETMIRISEAGPDVSRRAPPCRDGRGVPCSSRQLESVRDMKKKEEKKRRALQAQRTRTLRATERP
jgi:hypothetical protein